MAAVYVLVLLVVMGGLNRLAALPQERSLAHFVEDTFSDVLVRPDSGRDPGSPSL